MNAANKRFDRIAGGELRRLRTSAAEYLTAEGGFKACQTAVLVHGGYGYAREYHIERYLREMMIPPHRPRLSAIDALLYRREGLGTVEIVWSKHARKAGR